MRLAIETEEVARRVCVVAPTGELGTERVVVDLTQTTFMDSTALGVLLGALENQRTAGGISRS